MDAATMYAEARERVIGLATEAGDRMDGRVPGTPEWNGRQLLAHLVGMAADLTASGLEGAGGPEWTARQVREREGRSVEELADEWRGLAGAVESLLRKGPDMVRDILGADLLEHELDLRGMLGAPVPESCEAAIEPYLNFMMGFLDGRVKKAGLPPLLVRAGNQEWTLGSGGGASGESGPVLSTTELELFRVLVGRRSEAQVRALDWAGDPGPYLGVLNAFGPLPAEDVQESLA